MSKLYNKELIDIASTYLSLYRRISRKHHRLWSPPDAIAERNSLFKQAYRQLNCCFNAEAKLSAPVDISTREAVWCMPGFTRLSNWEYNSKANCMGTLRKLVIAGFPFHPLFEACFVRPLCWHSAQRNILFISALHGYSCHGQINFWTPCRFGC